MIRDNLLTDPVYQDYRELICYERPASIFLHFEHGLHHLPLLLFDRSLVEKKDGRVVGMENQFARFLEDHNVLQESELKAQNSDELWIKMQALWQEGPQSVFLMTYFNELSGEILLSTWVVEPIFDESSRQIKLTSLRGDDFFVRKTTDFDYFFSKLHQVNQVFDLQILRFFPSIKKLAHLAAEEFIGLEKIDLKIEEVAKKISSLRLDGQAAGTELLIQEVESWQLDSDDLAKKVRNGYKSVLLVKFFWPVQFHYKPFLVFVKHYLHAKNILDPDIQTLLQQTNELTDIVVALSQKFGLTGQAKILPQFKDIFLSLLHLTVHIEDTRYVQKKKDYRVQGISPQSKVLKNLLDTRGVYIASKHSTATILHLDDASAMSDPQSGYRNKHQVRESLKGSEFEIKFQAVESVESLKNWTFPFVMKTSSGWGSCQVYRVTDNSHAHQAFNDIKRFHRIFFPANETVKVLAEEELSGPEYAAEVVNINGHYEVIGIFEKAATHQSFLLDHTYILNGDKQRMLWDRFRSHLLKLCKILGTEAPYLHIEFRFDDQTHRLGIIEVNFRMGGGGFLTWLAFKSCGFPFLNPKAQFVPEWQPGVFADLVPRIQGHGLIREIHGRQFIEAHPAHLLSVWTKNPGDYYTPPPRGFDYPVEILTYQKSEKDFFDFVKEVELILRFDYAQN